VKAQHQFTRGYKTVLWRLDPRVTDGWIRSSIKGVQNVQR